MGFRQQRAAVALQKYIELVEPTVYLDGDSWNPMVCLPEPGPLSQVYLQLMDGRTWTAVVALSHSDMTGHAVGTIKDKPADVWRRAAGFFNAHEGLTRARRAARQNP